MLKPSKLVGWSHQQQQPTSLPSSYQQTPHQLKQHTEPWMTQSPGTTATTTASIISTPSNNTSPKDPATNTSLDSGVAGLRDTPVHTPGPTHHNNNNNNMPGPKSINNNEDYDVPKFIVDQTTRTTYMKGRFLGKGGFARVHELTDLTTNVTYAGKIIPKSRITKPHHKEKIAREIEVHRQLHHQHVVRFHHYFEDDSNVYIILENCSMRSLVHVVKYRRTLTEPEVRYYIRQLAEGVAYIHGVGIIHRDLKLGNMFLSHDMRVKIGDFGLATRTADTRQVTICGTPNYIAPEVLNRFGHYYQADIWAIGCIMYALLVGQPPFETETLKETYSRITNNQYVIPPLVSAQGRALITDLLHPEPKSRPTVHELLQHDFFTQGFIPPSLPTSACTQVPKFGLDAIGKSVSMPEQHNQQQQQQQQQQYSQVISQDIKKITTSVSTLRLPNLKPQQDKISILTDNLSHQIPAISNNNRNTNNNLLNNNNNIHSPPSPTPQQQQPPPQVHLTVQQRLNQQNSQQRQQAAVSSSSTAATTTASSALVSQATTVSQAKESGGSGRRKDGMRLFEKLTSVIYAAPDAKGTTCLGGIAGSRRRDVTSGTLYNLLAACLDSMPDGVNSNPPCLSSSPLFISKWIDYSNKYGFGYQLSDHSVGVFFNDLTRINISPDKSRVEFHDCSGRLSVESSASLPVWLQERYQLLLYFAAYMDENLTEAGETSLAPSSSRSSSSSSTSSSNNSSTSSAGSTGGGSSSNNGASSSKCSGSGGTQTIPYIRRWDRTPKSIIMQLSNGTFQINFFKDHTKIVVSGGENASLLFIGSERASSSYSLAHVASSGCDAVIRERLVYALSCLRQYAELDGEEV